MLRVVVFLGISFRETFVQERVGVWHRCQVAQRLIGVLWLCRFDLCVCLSLYIVMTMIGCDYGLDHIPRSYVKYPMIVL